MQRRTFIKNTALSAVAVSAFGFIEFDGKKYTGDCETTTDILGPFYRPGSPVQNNLAIKGEPGDLIELSGIIKHKDCTTPYQKAKIELWHCDAKGVYDNSSPDFRYRGTSYSDAKGHYSFNTILPVPYDVGDGSIRPAHFHLMITAEGYQPLVTQLYFTGDVNIKKDVYAASPKAKRRILNVQNLNNGTKKVVYDVSMVENLTVETATIDKLTGIYTDKADKTKSVEFFKSDNALWRKNEVFGAKFDYTGNNTFEYPGMPPGMYRKLYFEILVSSNIQLTEDYMNSNATKHTIVYLKEK